MSDVLGAMAAVRIVPVVTIDDVQGAVSLASALAAGGLDVVEITLRTEAGMGAISEIADKQPSTVVGAGSVMSGDQAKQAIDAGAQFLVSPGLDDGVVQTALDSGVPIVPGVATATELMRAASFGLEVVKFFPAEAAGGIELLRAFSAVWPNIQFMPTGGISADNVVDYLVEPSVLAVGGSWMAPRDFIASRDWSPITTLASEASKLAASAR